MLSPTVSISYDSLDLFLCNACWALTSICRCDCATDDVFHELAANGCQENGTVAGWGVPISFLKDWLDCCMAPNFRDHTSAEGQPEEISKGGGYSSYAIVTRRRHGMMSDPVALRGLKSLRTRSVDISMSGMNA